MGQTILTPFQITALNVFKSTPLVNEFYLSGGTALSEFYLHHRKSEDLDFFTQKELDIEELKKFTHLLSQKIPLENHFKNKQKAKLLFDLLLVKINESIGKVKPVSLPCCIHLFGKYDFLAALPKKDRLEIRFSLDRKLKSKRLKIAVPVSSKSFKNCIDINEEKEIDEEIMNLVREAYYLKG